MVTKSSPSPTQVTTHKSAMLCFKSSSTFTLCHHLCETFPEAPGSPSSDTRNVLLTSVLSHINLFTHLMFFCAFSLSLGYTLLHIMAFKWLI